MSNKQEIPFNSLPVIVRERYDSGRSDHYRCYIIYTSDGLCVGYVVQFGNAYRFNDYWEYRNDIGWTLTTDRYVPRCEPGKTDHSLWDRLNGTFLLNQQGFGVCDRAADSLNDLDDNPVGEIAEIVENIKGSNHI